MNVMASFKGRIVAVVILLLTLSLAISSFLSYRQLSTSIQTSIDNYSMLKIDSTSDTVSNWISAIKKAVVSSAPDFAIDKEGLKEKA